MIRLVSPSRLKKLGIVGMNKRNIGVIGKYNQRSKYPLVDDKLKTKQLALSHNIPTPDLYGVVEFQFEVKSIIEKLARYDSFVIKPAQGSGGKGIIVIVGRDGDKYLKASGVRLDEQDLSRDISNILAGLYSLGGRNDKAMIEALIDFDPTLVSYSYEGVPDLRVIVYRGVPVMAMMRCATHQSDGKANLHQGAVGVGIDIGTGRALCAVQHGHLVDQHPDTQANFDSLEIPCWDGVLDLASRCAEITGLGYIGADIVLDKNLGPMLLELNARPGLAIQVANQAGLQPRLTEAAKIAAQLLSREEKIRLAKTAFSREYVEPLASRN